MNVLEKVLDEANPTLSARARLLKCVIRRDPTIGIFKRLVDPGDTVIDIGAHKGAYTAYLADRVGDNGRVHAIEAFPGNIHRLETMADRRSQITVHGVAAGAEAGTAELHVPISLGESVDAMSSLEEMTIPHLTAKVDVVRLDDHLAAVGHTALIKCDVEGHEYAVADGATRLLSETDAFICEIEQRHHSRPISEVIDRMCSFGGEPFFVQRDRLRSADYFNVDEHQTRHLANETEYGQPPADYVTDFLFVRDLKRIADLIGG